MAEAVSRTEQASKLRRSWPTAALVLLAFGYLAYENFYTGYLTPPSPHCTLAELAGCVPAPVRLAFVTGQGATRLVWIGSIPRFAVRSGPPCYVFDTQGRLIDWRAETGEGWSLDPLRIAAYDEPAISLDEALRRCNDSAAQGVLKTKE
ncbi:MAG TPA: hypothetical protein VMF30_16675 [Pirellulales bacterium]|nr:hypothetical protein [Pirellulales bacterium]